MDFKDKIIIICLLAIACLLAIIKLFCMWDMINSVHKQEPEPVNEIIYNVVDVNGDIVGTIKADHLKKCY